MPHKDPEQRKTYLREYRRKNPEKKRAEYRRNKARYRAMQKRYNAKNTARIAEIRRSYYLANKGRIDEYFRRYRKAHPDSVRSWARTSRRKNAAKRNAYNSEYWIARPDEAAARNRRLYAKHKDKYAARSAAYKRRLASAYLAALISQQTGIPVSAVPPHLIEAKRLHIQLTRVIKEKRK